MANQRISFVVLKSVCTPVPPIRYGYVAGDAGYAPPRNRVARNGRAHPGSQRQHSSLAAQPSRTQKEATRISRCERGIAQYSHPNEIKFELIWDIRTSAAAPAQREERMFRRKCSTLGLFAVTAQSAAWRDAQCGSGRKSRVREQGELARPTPG